MFICSARFFCDEVSWNLGAGSETFGTSGMRNTALRRDIGEVRVGFLDFVDTAFDLAHVLQSSTVPFSQVAMISL